MERLVRGARHDFHEGPLTSIARDLPANTRAKLGSTKIRWVKVADIDGGDVQTPVRRRMVSPLDPTDFGASLTPEAALALEASASGGGVDGPSLALQARLRF